MLSDRWFAALLLVTAASIAAGCGGGRGGNTTLPMVLPAAHRAQSDLRPEASGSLCVGGTEYATSQDDEFSEDSHLNAVPTDINASPAPAAMWSTAYSWGRVNNPGADDAFYADTSVTPYFSPFSLANHALNIETEPVPASHLGNAILQGRGWLSGALEGKPLTYGYVEVAAKEPNLQGFWPAPIWLLGFNGSDGKGNGYSELDGNELFGNSLGPNIVQQTQIMNNNPVRASRYVRTRVVPNPQTTYHTYGILWTPATVSFYIDRVATSPSWPNAATGPMNPIINLQVFTPYTWAPGPVTKSPQYLNVAYYRWYQSKGSSCSPSAVATPPTGPTPKPTPTPVPSPEPSVITLVQQGPVVTTVGWLKVTATLKAMPKNGDMLVLISTTDNVLTPPPGWKWITPASSGRGTLNLMYGIVGQNGLEAATSYKFGGNRADCELFEFHGGSQTITPSVSSDPADDGLVRTRELTIPAARGLTLVVWGARSDTTSGGVQSIVEWVPPGQADSRLTNDVNHELSGGGALTLVASKLTTDPLKAPQPFRVKGTIAAGNAPNLIIDGDIIWFHP